MIMLGLMAVLGAFLGAVVRPGLVGAPIAIGVAEAARGLIGALAAAAIDNATAPWWSQAALALVQDPMAGYLPLLGASGGAAILAALLAMLVRGQTRGQRSLDGATDVRRKVVNGHYVRAEGMVEERSRQQEAEARQRQILGL